MSVLTSEVDILRRVPLFSGIEAPKLKLLAFTSKLVRYEASEVLFRQGDPGDSAFVILSGQAVVIADTPGGEIEIARLGETDFVGEIGILCDMPRTATVRAVTNVKALRIGKDCLVELLENFPSIGLSMLRGLALRLSRTTAELVEYRSHDA
ncbi:cyclic nucleotide-binding domain-containing protein [Mangrovicella endophytica]|uniref:cyclic nucleotide-binding domain-containing protein n=1 Tax=Mangrovicella endophytica TaxID=2066697 RepID=UPI000C9E9519|nr:cyclic nucleotide-binding domain-containing protein [Mangrovicella endophytica]